MQVADLLLCDRRKRIDRVEPGVKRSVISELFEALILELDGVLDTVDGANEASSLGEHLVVGIAEILDVVDKVSFILDTIGALHSVSKGTQLTQHEVAGMEALGNDNTH